MSTIQITTTQARDLSVLRTGGHAAADSWPQLRALLSRELSDHHAALFAEPVHNPLSGETDWYTEGELAPQPLATLPPLAQQAAIEARDRLLADIAALATRLKQRNGPQDRFNADILSLAIMTPGNGSTYMQGLQPILVAWGHVAPGAKPDSKLLEGRRDATPAPMAIKPPPRPVMTGQARSGHWLLWPAALLPLLALLALFAMNRFERFEVEPGKCEVAPEDVTLLAKLDREQARHGELLRKIATVTGDAGRRRLQCLPAPAAPSPPPGIRGELRDISSMVRVAAS